MLGAKHVLSLAVVAIALTCFTPVTGDDVTGDDSKVLAAVDLNPNCVIELPFVPWALELAGIALSLGNVKVSGLNDYTVSKVMRKAHWPHVRFVSDPYVSKGWIYTLPLSGRGKLTIDIEDLQIKVSIKPLQTPKLVPVLTMSDFRVHFTGMNPGTESGDLINAFLCTLTDDIADLLTEKLQAIFAKLTEKETKMMLEKASRMPTSKIALCVEKEVLPETEEAYKVLASVFENVQFEFFDFLEDFVETGVQKFSQKTRKTRV